MTSAVPTPKPKTKASIYTQPNASHQTLAGDPAGLWLPPQLGLTDKSNQRLYSIDSTHRGDMYHVRAARALDDHPLIVYNCEDPAPGSASRAPGDLERYLCASTATPFGQTSANRQQLLEKSSAVIPNGFFDVCKPGEAQPVTVLHSDFIKISKSIYNIGEGECTTRVVRAVATAVAAIKKDTKSPVLDNTLLKIAAGIIKIHKPADAAVDALLDPLLRSIFGKVGIDEKSRAVLLMHRATGITLGEHAYTDEKNAKATRKTLAKGVYPENDTDDGFCIQIAKMVEGARYRNGSRAKAVLCGNSSPVAGVDSIGEWFKAIDLKQLEAKVRSSSVTPRDVEARFMQLAYQKGYIGLLDGLLGGERMNQLGPDLTPLQDRLNDSTLDAKQKDAVRAALTAAAEARTALTPEGAPFNAFKRCNINYATPRHDATKIRESSRVAGLRYFNSPFWAGDFLEESTDKTPSPAEQRALHQRKPRPLADGPGDLERVKSGVVTFMGNL